MPLKSFSNFKKFVLSLYCCYHRNQSERPPADDVNLYLECRFPFSVYIEIIWQSLLSDDPQFPASSSSRSILHCFKRNDPVELNSEIGVIKPSAPSFRSTVVRFRLSNRWLLLCNAARTKPSTKVLREDSPKSNPAFVAKSPSRAESILLGKTRCRPVWSRGKA